MDRPSARRPLPALAFLLALSLLTALVWWRVIHRGDNNHQTAPTPCPTPSNSVVPQAAAVSLDVLNSTNRDGLAHTVSTSLGSRGFHIADVGNDSNLVTGVAEIRFGSKGSPGATLVSFYLPGATLVPTQSSDSEVVISLGAKFKAVATTTQAKKAMASQHVTQIPAKNRPLNVTPTPSPSATC